MYSMSNEMNSSEILNKFDGFHNSINVIKTKLVNEINSFLTYIQTQFFKKILFDMK